MKKTIIWLSVASIFTVSYLDRDKEAQRVQKREQQVISQPPSTMKNVRAYDFDRGTFTNYSDEEIRIMREKQSYQPDGGYIYTPGRKIKTREEEIESYIEDNIDDILDEHMEY